MEGASHIVIDKLSQTKDNISKLAVIHIDEIVSISKENSPYHTKPDNHQWLDQNGWLHRNANVINVKTGQIYNLTFDIAKTADGRTILYTVNGKIKRVGSAEVNSLKLRGSGQNSNSADSISLADGNVNTPDKKSLQWVKNLLSGWSLANSSTRLKGVKKSLLRLPCK